jgi:tRNA(adenine34) deaminase
MPSPDTRAAALAEADRARAAGDVPIGAVGAVGGAIVGRGLTQPIGAADPTAHAEMVVIRKAAARVGGGRLIGTTLYVTLEPCAMCAGAIVLAKIGRLVYGTGDPKSGMCGSLANIVQDRRLNHHVRLTAGVLADEAGELLRGFFRARR